jgi:foldase protein PrsA
VITKSTFDHWVGVAARSSQAPGAPRTAVVAPDPPKFSKCIAAKQAQQAKPAPGQPKQTDAQLKAACQQEFAGLRDQVMSFLISARWIDGEAADQGVSVSDSAVQKEFQKQKRQSFPKDADYKKFLKSSGMTQQDILLRVKLDLLSNKIRTKVTKAKTNVTDQQIQSYYAQNRQRFAQPERRDLLVVLTKTQANANQAKAALAKGQSFASVAAKFSIDPTSKSQGGKLTVVRGQQDKALDAAIFAAAPNQLNGPVKTQFGFYVFKLVRVTPAAQQSFAQVKETIRRILATQGQQGSLQAFVKKFQAKWKARTDCRKEYIVQTCKNAPKPTPQPGIPGAVPQQGGTGAGGSQQAAPQQGSQQAAPQQGSQQAAPQQGAQQAAPQQAAPQQTTQPSP